MRRLIETPFAAPLSRRRFLEGFGAVALWSLLRGDALASDPRAGPAPALFPNFAPRAKRVIYMHMVGGPSQVDLLDPKAELKKRDGELCPEAMFEGKQLAFIRERPTLLGSPYGFAPAGQCGLEVSELLPHFKTIADDVTVIRSMRTDEINHGPAQLFLLTGSGRFGRPSTGAWLSYGLGSENQNLPGFIVLVTGPRPGAGNAAWGSGFLPTVHQGVEFRSQGAPVLFLTDPAGMQRDDRRAAIDTIKELNGLRLAEVEDPEIQTRISQYEMAYRMQTSVPDVMDISKEPESVHEMYGTKPGRATFANNCLLARRLIERDVRFVQLFDSDWDHHNSVFTRLPEKCAEVDRAMTALVKDLKQRGLLDDTLVVWTSEFGRTPMAQSTDANGNAAAPGRDHHREAFTTWMAGGGVKAGYCYGATDDLGYEVAEKPVHVHDWNATFLHLLGIDHEKLIFRYQGRDFRLTDVHGEVVKDLIA